MSPRKAKKGAYRPPGRKATPPTDLDESAVMTLREAAAYLNCHYATALRLASQGKIPGFRLLSDSGGSWRALKSELDKWIAKGGAPRPYRRGPKPKSEP